MLWYIAGRFYVLLKNVTFFRSAFQGMSNTLPLQQYTLQHGGRREGSGRKRIWASVKEAAKMRMRKMRAKKKEVEEKSRTQLLQQRVRQLEMENAQLRMRQFEQQHAAEFNEATSEHAHTDTDEYTRTQEADRTQLTEGEFLQKYKPHRMSVRATQKVDRYVPTM